MRVERERERKLDEEGKQQLSNRGRMRMKEGSNDIHLNTPRFIRCCCGCETMEITCGDGGCVCVA